MITIKIGGSVLNNKKLTTLLKLIVEQKKSCVLIPGGGAFADIVRQQQQILKFDDLTAHNLCILSMLKVAHILKSKISNYSQIIKTRDETLSLDNKKIGIWNPDNKITNKKNKLTSWNATSDTIAVNIAIEIYSNILIILKSCEIPGDSKNIETFRLNKKKAAEFSKMKILDKAFPSVFSGTTFPVYVISIKRPEHLKVLLNNF